MERRFPWPVGFLTFSLAIAACGGAHEGTTDAPAAPARTTTEAPASTAPVERTTETTEDGEEPMKIRMTVGNEVFHATLFDNPTSRDFVSLLPLTLTLSDYAGTEKVSDLPRRLSTDGAPPGFDPSVGAITYYAPWGNLAIFYNDFRYADGLVEIGSIESGIERFAEASDESAVTVELAD